MPEQRQVSLEDERPAGLRIEPLDDDEDGDPAYDAEADEVDPAYYANGGVSLSDAELAVVGDVTGKRVLILGCGAGEEACSFANLGANVVAVGEPEEIMEADELAHAAGLDVTFAPAEEDAAVPGALRQGAFDLVYNSFGMLATTPNFDDWAQDVADALKPGGRLIVYDEHPFGFVFEELNGRLIAATPYLGPVDDEDEDGVEDSVEGALEEIDDELGSTAEERSESSWTLGELIGALSSAGLLTADLQELETSDRYETALDRFEEVEDGLARTLPSALVLLALKASEE